MSSAEQHKADGNSLHSERKYACAVEAYTCALLCEGLDDMLHSTIRSNRSMCYTLEGEYWRMRRSAFPSAPAGLRDTFGRRSPLPSWAGTRSVPPCSRLLSELSRITLRSSPCMKTSRKRDSIAVPSAKVDAPFACKMHWTPSPCRHASTGCAGTAAVPFSISTRP